jgi:hypothetical protein
LDGHSHALLPLAGSVIGWRVSDTPGRKQTQLTAPSKNGRVPGIQTSCYPHAEEVSDTRVAVLWEAIEGNETGETKGKPGGHTN